MDRETTKIDERVTGHRTIVGTDWPVVDQLLRLACGGGRPRWQIVRGLCNGVPARAENYRTLREAREAF